MQIIGNVAGRDPLRLRKMLIQMGVAPGEVPDTGANWGK
jgi:hypothetical protein